MAGRAESGERGAGRTRMLTSFPVESDPGPVLDCGRLYAATVGGGGVGEGGLGVLELLLMADPRRGGIAGGGAAGVGSGSWGALLNARDAAATRPPMAPTAACDGAENLDAMDEVVDEGLLFVNALCTAEAAAAAAGPDAGELSSAGREEKYLRACQLDLPLDVTGCAVGDAGWARCCMNDSTRRGERRKRLSRSVGGWRTPSALWRVSKMLCSSDIEICAGNFRDLLADRHVVQPPAYEDIRLTHK